MAEVMHFSSRSPNCPDKYLMNTTAQTWSNKTELLHHKRKRESKKSSIKFSQKRKKNALKVESSKNTRASLETLGSFKNGKMLFLITKSKVQLSPVSITILLTRSPHSRKCPKL